MNIYQMYVFNGNRVSFWISKKNWEDTIAKVTSIAGKKSGQLTGYPPYFNNPTVKAHIFKISTGELVEENSKISCPGTYVYEFVEKKDIPYSIQNHQV